MLRTATLFLLAVQIQIVTSAQFPSLNFYSVSKISTVFFNVTKPSGKGKNNAEVPPWIIPGGFHSYFFVDGSDSYVWSTPSSLTDNSAINLDEAVGPNQASQSYIHDPAFDPHKNVENWKRNYEAIYSAVYIDHPVEGPISLGFLHGENKNEISEGEYYQNTIQPNVKINPSDPDSYSGGSPFHDGWSAYNAMINAAWTPNNKQTNWGQKSFNNELGPIAWPSTGYVTKNGIKCTSGLRHPSSLVSNGFIYIFYTDAGPYANNIPEEEGRKEGIKLVRVPLADALKAHDYKVYYRDESGTDSWLPSLPDGFNKDNMLNFVSVKGSKSTDIMGDENNTSEEIRFSVAKVRNKDYFMGVEEYIDVANGGKYKVALRFSNDLIHWSTRAMIIATADNWNKTRLNYPVFLSKDGWSNTEIDIDDFYVLGTGTTPGNFVNKIHLTSSPVAAGQLLAFTSYMPQNIYADAIYPNPSSGSFQFSYYVDALSQVRIDIFDISGKRLATIDNEQKDPGKYLAKVDLSSYPNGIYIMELAKDDKRRSYKLVKD